MPSPSTTNILTYGLLAAAAGFAIMLPAELGPQRGLADPGSGPAATTVRLTGVIRDFRRTNSNFAVTPSGGNGHYAGNVAWELGSNDRPAYLGTGKKVNTQWRDAAAHPVAPHLYMYSTGAPTKIPVSVASPSPSKGTFDTYNSSNGAYGGTNVGPAPTWDVGAPMPQIAVPHTLRHLTSAGNADYSGTTTISSDVRCNTLNMSGTVNITGNVSILAEGMFMMSNGTVVNLLPGARLRIYAMAGIASWNHVLLNGNTKNPQRVTIYNGGTADYMIHNHAEVYATIVSPNAIMELNNHGALFGRFIGKTIKFDNHGDMHVDGAAPRDMCDAVLADTAGAFGAASNGGLVSAARFADWYVDTMGINLSMQHAIDLTLSSDSVYEYLDDSFHPCDGLLFGNEGQSHNNYFTYAVDAAFTHHSCDQRFFEFQGCDDAWLFVNGQLVMDLGGIVPGTSQYVDFNRLNLIDGKVYTLNFFYAQRNPNLAVFRMRTNLDLTATTSSYTVSAGHD